MVQGAVDGVVSAGFDFDRDDGEIVIVVDEVVDFAFLAIVVIKELVAVGMQLARDDALIDGTEIDAACIVEDGANVIAEKDAREDADVVEIEFEEVFGAGSDEWKGWGRDGAYFEGNAGADEIIEFILIAGEGLAFFSFDVFDNDALLFVFQI